MSAQPERPRTMSAADEHTGRQVSPRAYAELDAERTAHDAMRERAEAAEARLSRLRPLVRWAFVVWDWTWAGGGKDSEDGWELAEKAEACGLAERAKYDPDIHGETEADPGDLILYPSDMDPAVRAWALGEEGAGHE